MTTSTLSSTLTLALPDVAVTVRDLPADHAIVYSGITGQEYIVVAPYYGPTEPRPLICVKHGLQRHNWNAWRKEYECKKCAGGK